MLPVGRPLDDAVGLGLPAALPQAQRGGRLTLGEFRRLPHAEQTHRLRGSTGSSEPRPGGLGGLALRRRCSRPERLKCAFSRAFAGRRGEQLVVAPMTFLGEQIGAAISFSTAGWGGRYGLAQNRLAMITAAAAR